jgi:3-hydroxyacyl-CoA dehydrogenase / enoyl-CoA hydratase / 3-hydroxybutyryl-CoA epimerase
MVVGHGRLGRKNGKGFYDYPANGPKSLWPGLTSIVGRKLDPDVISVQDLKDRYLFTVAIEAARCLFEGIVTDPREADVGSILGFGYAPYTGGAISFIDGMGLKAFVARAKALAAQHGPRFEPGEKLVAMAERGETFYGIYGERQKAA